MALTCPACSADVIGSGPCSRCGAPLASSSPSPGVLSMGAVPAPGPRRSPGRALLVTAAGLLTVGVAGAAVYAGTALGGGGTQPEDVLPANAIGFVKLDFDPAAGQKLAAYRLAQKFPDSGVTGEDSLRDDLIGSLLEGEDAQDYEDHVQPWLGQRAGVAWLAPGPDDSDTPRPVAALQVTDRDAAQEGLTALRDADPVSSGGTTTVWEFTADGDYVLLAEKQSVLDAALAGQEKLGDDERFTDAVAALDGDQVALGWLDVEGFWGALPEQERALAEQGTPGLDPAGTVVVGAHVEDDGVEVVGRSLDVTAGDAATVQALLDNSFGRTPPDGLVEQLPADSAVAVSLTGVGEGLTELWETYGREAASDEQLQSVIDTYGLRLPEDLSALLGSELAVGVGGSLAEGPPRIDVRVRTADPGRAVELIEQVRSSQDGAAVPGIDQVEVEQGEDGYTVHYPAGDESDAGELGDNDLFARTVPDVDRSGATYYIDVTRLVGATGAAEGLTETQRRNLEPVKAAGWTASVDEGGDGTFRLRVTVG